MGIVAIVFLVLGEGLCFEVFLCGIVALLPLVCFSLRERKGGLRLRICFIVHCAVL